MVAIEPMQFYKYSLFQADGVQKRGEVPMPLRTSVEGENHKNI